MNDKTVEAKAQTPAQRLQQWLDEATAHPHIKEPTAMSLATATPKAEPSVRTILLKGLDERGLVFYTNNQSQKGQEISINPHACTNFYWMPLMRQVRVSGRLEAVQTSRSDEYFHSRSRESQIGAHASQQSSPLESYEALMERYHALSNEFEGKDFDGKMMVLVLQIHLYVLTKLQLLPAQPLLQVAALPFKNALL